MQIIGLILPPKIGLSIGAFQGKIPAILLVISDGWFGPTPAWPIPLSSACVAHGLYEGALLRFFEPRLQVASGGGAGQDRVRLRLRAHHTGAGAGPSAGDDVPQLRAGADLSPLDSSPPTPHRHRGAIGISRSALPHRFTDEGGSSPAGHIPGTGREHSAQQPENRPNSAASNQQRETMNPRGPPKSRRRARNQASPPTSFPALSSNPPLLKKAIPLFQRSVPKLTGFLNNGLKRPFRSRQSLWVSCFLVRRCFKWVA